MSTDTSTGAQGHRPVVLHQVRDLAAALRHQADVLRETAIGLSRQAGTVRWQSSSASACLEELTDMVTRLNASAAAHDEAAAAVSSHADVAEAAGDLALRALTSWVPGR